MRHLLPLLLALAAAPASAQLRPYLAAGAGQADAPAAVSRCGGAEVTTLGFAAGVTRGLLGAEARLGTRSYGVFVQCIADAAREPPADGVHTERSAPPAPDLEIVPELRLRAGGVGRIPFLVFAGAGRNLDQGVTFGTVGAGLRLPGRFRLGVDLERSWYAVPFDVYTREWSSGHVVRQIDHTRETEWQGATGVRVLVEMSVGRR